MATSTTKKKAPAKKAATKRTSGNPAKAAEQAAAAQAASDVSAFKRRTKGVHLPLPSGLTVRAKRVELQTLIKKGNVPNPLMEVVSESLKKGQQMDVGKMVGVEEDEIDLDMVNDMFDMVERVCLESITEPKVYPLPTEEDVQAYNAKNPDVEITDPEELRNEDLLYIDEVDPEDKMFIYQWACGGTSDLDQFRSEARADMATLAEKQGSGAKAK